jgi:Domain of unknown function (DUF4349)
MSGPDVIDERYDGLVRELRAARPTAPDPVRERVRQIAARPPAPVRRRRLSWVLAPTAAVAVAAAVTIAVVDSGNQPRDLAATDVAPKARQGESQSPLQSDSALAARSGAPVAPGRRAQLYRAEMTIRVRDRDLSDATQEALRITRGVGGYVRSVEYGSGDRSGFADLVLRVPIGRVQDAIVRYSNLGTIVEQHVSVRDVQPEIDRRFARIQRLKRDLAALSGDSSIAALARRDQLEAELAALQAAQRAQRAKASFATVAVRLTTKDAAVVPPGPPGRIERALDDAVGVLEAEAEALVYALVIGAPFVLAGIALLALARAHRRRADQRLLGYP